MKSILTLFILSLFIFNNKITAQVFVKSDAVGANDGSSWQDAFTDLEIALLTSTEDDQIWVAAGTYKAGGSAPTVDTFFTFPHDLQLYGGFIGTETDLSQRDWETNETILSADHNGDDVDNEFDTNKADNSLHIMWLTDTITNATIIDGFYFKYGNTQDGNGAGNDRRAGAILSYGAPIIRNCNFSQNYGYFGGAVYPRLSGAAGFIVENCTFENNVGRFGGGIYTNATTGSVTDCNFSSNLADDGRGGGLYTSGCDLEVSNCNFDSNISSTSSGGGLMARGNDDFFSTINVTDCIFSNNTAMFGGAAGCYDSTTIMNLTNCTFETNTSSSVGGAMTVGFQGNATFTNCAFNNNNADNSAGAIYVQNDNSRLTIDGSSFMSNGAARGGAIATSGDGDTLSVGLIQLNISKSTFVFNTAIEQGGALNIGNSDINIINSLIRANLTTNSDGIGGAISLNTSDQVTANYSLLNSTIANNSASLGAGIAHWAETETAISTLTLQNTILKNPSGLNYEIEFGAPILVSAGGNLNADLSTELELVATNDINGELPMFVDPDELSDNLRLAEGSPCIDMGIEAGAPLLDLDGNERVDEIDMGAYENQKLISVFEPNTTFGDLKIFPNMVKTELYYTFEDDWIGAITIQVVDQSGKVVYTQDTNKPMGQITDVFAVNRLARGVYRLVVSNGSAINSKPFIKL